MLEHIFDWVYQAVAGSAWVALSASLAWGMLSVLVSPCHLSSIPLIVGFISGQGKMTRAKAFGISSLFALGVLVTIAILGIITGAMGKMWGDVGVWGNYVVAVIFFLVGLNLMGVIPTPFSGPGNVGMKRRGALAAFTLGLVFGIALGPCTFGFMIPVLEASRRAAAESHLLYGISLVALYGIGHCLVIAFAGASAEAVQNYLNWNEKSKGAIILRRVCGVLVLLAGAYLIYNTL